MLTIKHILKDNTLKDKHILETLIAHFCKIPIKNIYQRLDFQISSSVSSAIISAYESHILDHKPLAYILWYVTLFNKNFLVDSSTLIPRIEMEDMTDNITNFINLDLKKEYHNPPKMVLLDIGTWTWARWLSILLKNTDSFSHAILTDYYSNPLKIAKKNYLSIFHKSPNKRSPRHTKTYFIQSDLLQFMFDKTTKSVPFHINNIKKYVTILVANLPYVPEKDFDNIEMSVKKLEPRSAFTWWKDGLCLYRSLLNQIYNIRQNNTFKLKNNKKLYNNWRVLYCFFKMLNWQLPIIKKEFSSKFIFKKIMNFDSGKIIIKIYLR